MGAVAPNKQKQQHHLQRFIGGSVVDNVPPITGLIGWRSVVELRRLRLVLMSGGVPAEQRSRAYARCRDDR